MSEPRMRSIASSATRRIGAELHLVYDRLEELSNCGRTYVFREGRATDELVGDEIEPNRILEASFGGAHG